MDHRSRLRPFIFTNLPPEVRNEIYKYLLPVSKSSIDVYVSAATINNRLLLTETEKLAKDANPSQLPAYFQKYSAKFGRTRFNGITLDRRTNQLRGILSFRHSCRTVCEEFTSMIAPLIVFNAWSLEACGWLGLRLSTFSPSIQHLCIIHVNKQMSSTSQLQSWSSIILSKFTGLQSLDMRVQEVKNIKISGSRFRSGDLRLFKFLLENTSMEVAYVTGIDRQSHRAQDSLSDAHPYNSLAHNRYWVASIVIVYFTSSRTIPDDAEEVDVSAEYKAWLNRRKGGLGDLEWNMRD